MLIERNGLTDSGLVGDLMDLLALIAEDFQDNGDTIVYLLRNGGVVSAGKHSILIIDSDIRMVSVPDIQSIEVSCEVISIAMQDGKMYHTIHREYKEK